MILAVDNNNNKILAQKGLTAICPHCKSEVIAKCGEINIWHFAHVNKEDCDSWSEGETYWHLQWKEYAKLENVEYTISPHRADIFNTFTQTVIELQHSPISPEEIRERELFYKNMIWILYYSEKNPEHYYIKHFENAKAEDDYYIHIDWKSKILSTFTKPVFLDFNNSQDNYLYKITGHGEKGVYTKRISKENFITRYFNNITSEQGYEKISKIYREKILIKKYHLQNDIRKFKDDSEMQDFYVMAQKWNPVKIAVCEKYLNIKILNAKIFEQFEKEFLDAVPDSE